MTKIKLALGVIIVAGVGTTVMVEHKALTKLREQNKALQQQFAQQTWQTEPLAAKHVPRPRLPTPRMAAAGGASEPAPDSSWRTNLLERLLEGDESLKLAAEQLEPYLGQNRRSAESLLAAFRSTEDKNYLREALEKYPKDARVNFAAWGANSYGPDSTPEDRRLRLDALKASAPDNALADYLSAQEHFRTGQSDQAVEDLVAAAGKRKFEDYSRDFVQSAEEAYRAAGYSEAESKAIASCSLPLPQLARMKVLGQDLVEMAARYGESGDEASANAARQMGILLAQQVSEGAGSHYLINELVGSKIESQILESLDPASPYDGDGRTIQDRLDELARTRQELKSLGVPVKAGEQQDALVAMWERLPPQDIVSFFDRIKVSGEREALRWALNKLDRP